MKKFRSHKIVEAEVIKDILDYARVIITVDGQHFDHPKRQEGRSWESSDGKYPRPGDYLVRYADGYLSWSPKAAFEEGYTEFVEPKFSAQTKVGAMRREAGFRRGVYAKKVASGAMSQEDMDAGIAIIEEIAREYMNRAT